jgi:hypothetical protein
MVSLLLDKFSLFGDQKNWKKISVNFGKFFLEKITKILKQKIQKWKKKKKNPNLVSFGSIVKGKGEGEEGGVRVNGLIAFLRSFTSVDWIRFLFYFIGLYIGLHGVPSHLFFRRW